MPPRPQVSVDANDTPVRRTEDAGTTNPRDGNANIKERAPSSSARVIAGRSVVRIMMFVGFGPVSCARLPKDFRNILLYVPLNWSGVFRRSNGDVD